MPSTVTLAEPMTLDPIRRLGPVSLDELNANAALLTRIDRKYVADVDVLEDVLSGLDPRTRVLEIDGSRSFMYQSVYFDTADFDSYCSAAFRRRRRFKVRTRTYVDSGECWIEIKTRGPRKRTVKSRTPHDPSSASRLDGRALAFVAAALADGGIAPDLAADLLPMVRTGFMRTTLWLPADGARVTIDRDFAVTAAGGCVGYPGLAIVETKSGSAPSQVDHLLWSHGVRPAKVSKFAIGMTGLGAGLPTNKWHRVLNEHFVPRAQHITPRLDERSQT